MRGMITSAVLAASSACRQCRAHSQMKNSSVASACSAGGRAAAQVGACTRNMNTFAFVGDLERSPEVSCVYHSEDAENQFLRNPKRAAMGDGFQPREDAAAQAARTAAEAP